MRNKRAVFTPPIEPDSLFLEVTRGCSYNQCAFCGTYRNRPFKERDFKTIEEEVKKAGRLHRENLRTLFLGEGDALVASTSLLRKTLRLLKTELPNLQRVDIFGTPQALLGKRPKELASLRNEGLTNIYIGIESGSDKILEILNKGVTSKSILKAAAKAKTAGLKLSVLTILGAGGRHAWREHASETGKLLSLIAPDSIIIVTLVLVPETPLFQLARKGRFTPPTPLESVLELKDLIGNLDLSGTAIQSSHGSNYLKVSGRLPEDKEKMLHQLERVLNNPTEELFDTGYFRGA